MMYGAVAIGTQGDQVSLGIVAAPAAEFLVMNLKILRAAAGQTPPSVPLQDFSKKLLVRFRSQAQSWLLWSNPIHDAF